jgi:predicted enzyme related to lactoylglutathione lyase
MPEEKKVWPIFQSEIRTRDLARSMAFYAAVFDWKIYQVSPEYALVDPGLMPVIGIMETRDPRFPLGVVNNVIVDDCEREAKRAVELGGRITIQKWELPNQGWYMGTYDPWQNELLFWQPISAHRPNLVGTKQNPIVLVDIATTDIERAIKYYSTLCGWSFWSVVFDDSYAFAAGNGLARGVGLCAGPRARTIGSANYVAVRDLTETAAKVRAAGGGVVGDAKDFPGEGRIITIEDLDGNRLGALQRIAS